MAQGIKSTKSFYRWLIAILGGGLVLILATFVGIIPLVEYLQKPAYLDVLVTPAEAKVEIGGKEYRNAIYELEPGRYTATITLGDLEPEVVELDLGKNETAGLYMDWLEARGWKYYTPDELAHKNSIGEVTPLYLSVCGTPAKRTNCDAIAVNYDREPRCGSEKCLVISGRRAELTDEVLTAVRGKLAENDYSLDDYRYIYIQNDER